MASEYGPLHLHKASGKQLYNAPLMETADADEVFLWTEKQQQIGLGTFDKRFGRNTESHFSGYCMNIGGPSGYCELRDAAMDHIRQMAFGYLTIGLELIDHKDGWTLIVANYNEIIGGRWLAYVRTSTIGANPYTEKAHA